ncbi:YdbH domain-containing protein [Sphingosinicella sp. CPCC 101087]|uniref:intermembrane phospholipid transport protein YdbH family protein n=1 Tax=Sphingosinicella sp. CPCC 101087 TaxID=2497754 RepID=UPI00101B6A5F|nr:YdbH domain-containing protein [Sphingosinicella sp. CPCC 101087]
MDEQEIETVKRRPRLRRWRVALAIILVLLVGGLIVLWAMRVRLATTYIDRELERRGVEASYDIGRIGFGTQVLENLVIGDPSRPDAVARRVEVQILIGVTGPRVGLITARGVRMVGRIRDGRLTLGEIDRLLPPPSGLPFRLPDQRVDIADAAIALETPAGPVAVGVEGQGNLADGFRGRLAFVSPQLAVGECTIARPRANVAVSVADLRPRFVGPMALEAVNCGTDLAIERPLFALDATFAPALDSWRGETAVRAARFEAGAQRLAGLEGRVSFAGNARNTQGQVDVRSAAAAIDVFAARRTGFAGRYAVSSSGDLKLSGDARVQGLTLAGASAAALTGMLRSAEGTPVGPIGSALAGALDRAVRGGGEASAGVRLVNGDGFGAVRIERLRFAADSGLALRSAGGKGLTYYWPGGVLGVDGEYALSGGGFPDARLSLRQARAGAALEGIARIAPMAAGEARLALGEIRFAAAPDGISRFETAVRLDGPLGDGRVTGLTVPVRGRFGRGGLAIGESCVTAAFRTLEIAGLRIGPTRLPLCPTGRALVWQAPGGPLQAGAALRGPRLAGRLGESPVTLASEGVRIDLDGFAASAVAVRLGATEATSRLDLASLSGRFTSGGVAGTFEGAAGKLVNVPLLIGEGAGRWQFAGGNLLLEGGLQVADEQVPPRFHPLTSDDFRLTLEDSRIHAVGWLSHPASGTRVSRATIDHHLGTGAGEAVLDVPGLAFGEGFQPDTLTPLTVGIVALVEGNVTGRGRIAWDEAGVRSTGTFSTAGMNLAAPFGPVEGLDTTVEFTDLLGLVSAPGQVAEVDIVRSGVDVYDGRLSYQLLPNYNVAIEAGHWPFAGGELHLEPTVLDFSQPATKYLTFRVVGLDAAAFVQQMEFSNIAATGTFDGVIPMQFDTRGGRIVGGRMSARAAGGTLSYVGELTDRDLGAYGILAFNALKSLRYSRFDLTLDGALDGEFITVIDLDGIARDPTMTTVPSGGGLPGLVVGRVFRQLAQIPFEFNIRIQGQFRALMATARSFSDPTPLIQSVLPDILRDRSTTINDVQDEESEPVQ